LEVPEVQHVTTVASEVSVRFAENSFVGICAAGAINAL
jgi:hypothetical protein